MQIVISSIVAFFLILSLPSLLLASDKENCVIQDVKHASTQKQDTLKLSLSCKIKSPLSYHFDYGITEITIPNTSVKEQIYYKINNRFLKDINIQNVSNSTVLQISFADSNEQSVGLYDHEIKENNLVIKINKKPQKITDTTDIENKTDIIKPQEAIASGFMEESQASIIKMLAALFFILLIIYSLLWLYKRFTKNRFNFKNKQHNIRLISSYHIGSKQKIAIIEINNVSYACGITPSSINIISQVSDQSFWNYLKSTDQGSEKNKEIDFTRIKQEYREFKQSQQVEKSSKTKPKFASEFLKKVKNLKPID